jgi:hypothetical protein
MTMRFHRLLSITAFSVFLLCLSCGKSDGGPPEEDPAGSYYIRYKANGVSHEYTGDNLVHAFVLTLSETGAHQCLIQGRLHGKDQNKDAVFFGVTDKEPLKIGTTYRLGNWLEWPEHHQTISQVFGSHYSASGEQYFAQFRQLESFPFEVKDDATAQFSQINDKTVKGTFSMRAFTIYPALKEMTITDGEFYVPILVSNNP